MPDRDGYPYDSEVARLESWDLLKDPLEGFLDFLWDTWWAADWGFVRKDWKDGTIRLELHTGGWSGNEDIIAALQNNFLFWSLAWERAYKGGHYHFKIGPGLRQTWSQADPMVAPSTARPQQAGSGQNKASMPK